MSYFREFRNIGANFSTSSKHGSPPPARLRHGVVVAGGGFCNYGCTGICTYGVPRMPLIAPAKNNLFAGWRRDGAINSPKLRSHCVSVPPAEKMCHTCFTQVSMRLPGHEKTSQRGFQVMEKTIRKVGSGVGSRWDPGGIQGQKVGSGVKSCTIFQGKGWDPIVPTHAFIILKACNGVSGGRDSRILPALWYDVRPSAHQFIAKLVKM